MSKQYKYEIKKEDDGLIAVEVTVDPEKVTEVEEQVYETLKDSVKIQGFRPGKAPKLEIIKKLGTQLIDETFKKVIPDITAEIVDEENLNPVSQIDYDIKEFTPEGQLKFGFEFVNYPETKLADISKIKVARPEIVVEESEVDEVIERLFKSEDDSEQEEAPQITDEMANSLGLDGVATVEQLREQIKHRLFHVKEHDTDREYQDAVLDAVIEASEIPVPAKLIEQQTEELFANHISQIENLGVEVDTFLQAQGTNPDELRAKKKLEAEKKIKAELVLNEIARTFTVIPTLEDIDAEINAIQDPEVQDSYDTPNGRRYILSMLIQQRGMQKLMDEVSKNGVDQTKSGNKKSEPKDDKKGSVTKKAQKEDKNPEKKKSKKDKE